MNHILKRIFSLINKTRIYEIVTYNKKLQNKLEITLKDYQNLSGKFKIGGQNGNVKIYKLNTNLLLYEGEYKNGKKNGKGKEYYNNGEIIFEGIFKRGKKIGIGKEYLNCNKKLYLIFEGEYKNGNKNGKGKEFDKNGEVEFEGEYKNGKRNGKGIIYYYNGRIKYEGEFLNGVKHGKGCEYNWFGDIVKETL